MPLTLPDFERLRDLVYERTGIMFDERKVGFMENRLSARLGETGCDDAVDYYRLLRYRDPEGHEFQAFVESLTTNETYFFREYPQLECFANEVLPHVTQRKREAGDYTLRLWSAGCSTGDEPYTLAIILHACLDDFDRWRITVDATDIDQQVLAAAARGVYGPRALRDVPRVYLDRYFVCKGDDYAVCPSARNLVQFTHVNLMDRHAMRRFRMMDFIFCRNVLIYFDDTSRRQVLGSFYDSLSPGGFVFLGHSESVGRISAAFEPVMFNKTLVYRRPLVRAPGTWATGACR
jgi:chemotaxis protein methyltransferase CheR